MQLERYIEIGFKGIPTERQLEEISETVGQILETIKVSERKSRSEVYGWSYYSLGLEVTERTNIDPEFTLRAHIGTIREKLLTNYENVRHVSLGPTYAQKLNQQALQVPTNKSMTF